MFSLMVHTDCHVAIFQIEIFCIFASKGFPIHYDYEERSVSEILG